MTSTCKRTIVAGVLVAVFTALGFFQFAIRSGWFPWAFYALGGESLNSGASVDRIKTVSEIPAQPAPLEISPPEPPASLSKPFVEVALTRNEVENFLSKHRRDGSSLIAAFSILNDLSYLEEAIKKAPELPEVALAALAVGVEEPDAVWIRRLIDVDTDNALVQFLGSYEAFMRQDSEGALDALQRAWKLPEFNDYNTGRLALVEEAALDAGYSPTIASAVAAKSFNPVDALLPKYFELAEQVKSHLADYRDDAGGVDWILQAALKLGADLKVEREGGSLLIQAGSALYEKILYDGITESARFPSLKESPEVLSNQSINYKKQLVYLKQGFDSTGWLKRQDEPTVVSFYRKIREQGELSALLWALGPEKNIVDNGNR